ncbi:MAG TPA: bifunctional diguanylate cyclase/phosphodiesterase [Actinomycetes bacterium]
MTRRRSTGLLRAARRPPQWWGVAAVVACLLAVTAVLAVLTGLRPGAVSPAALASYAWLTVTFAVAEIFVLHIQVKREAQTLALSEIPLVFGLVFAGAGTLVAGLLTGGALAYVLHRRQRGLKLAYNLTLKTTDAVLAVALYQLVRGDAPAFGWRWMVATYVAIGAAALLDAVATQLVIGLHERSLSLRNIVSEIAIYPTLALGVGTVAMVGTYAYDASALSLLPACGAGAFLVIGYRTYSRLSDRHLSLERLYRFSQAVTSTPEVNETLGSVLAQAKELLRSEHAEITFFGTNDSVVRVALSPSGRLLRENLVVAAGDPTIPGPEDEITPLLMPRGTRDPKARAHLAARRSREAIVVPLRGDAGVIGTLAVADRLGDVRTFDVSDMRLLETVANHAGIALQNSRLIDQLRHESLHDALTGLPNRVLLQRRIADELDRVRQGVSRGCAVMIMDLDGFKDVNDTLGHQHGDDLLKVVAARTSQAAGATTTVARLGGDEFALLLPDCADGTTARAVALHVLGALQHPTDLEGIPVQVGASLGVSLAPSQARDASGLLKRADVAMYAAKSAGGGVRVYDADLDTSSPARLALVMDLRTALEQGGITVHVQPKADLATGAVNAVEVLARWDHPLHGVLGPDEFIPLAERAGLMRQLTGQVLDRALRSCRSWHDDGLAIGVAVNLSARSLTDVDLCDEVAAMLARHAVAPHLLTLEITESTVMSDPEAAIESLQRLRALGVRLAIDDFGIGYSSLSNLRRLPVQELKIDKSFVREMSPGGDDLMIVRSIVDLGRNLALDVVAEGVETHQAWRELTEMGCHFAQGYLVARPMPPGQFGTWLQGWHAHRRDSLSHLVAAAT